MFPASLNRFFVVVVTLLASACTTITPDYAREQRWAEEIVPSLVVGDAVRIETASKRRFLGILAESPKSRGAIILMHGSGVHPDFAIVGQLRSLLNDAGFSTLSIQMPVLAGDAPASDYPGVFAEANERIAAAIGGELHEEALGEIFGPNAGRIKGFEDLQCLLDGVESKARLQCDVGGRLGEETAVVETADQLSHRCQCRRREIRHFRLLHEMLLQ